MVISGEVNKKLVKELREMCKVLTIGDDGKKQDLVDRIRSKFID